MVYFSVFLHDFLDVGEVALAADLITAWESSREAALAADLCHSLLDSEQTAAFQTINQFSYWLIDIIRLC